MRADRYANLHLHITQRRREISAICITARPAICLLIAGAGSARLMQRVLH